MQEDYPLSNSQVHRNQMRSPMASNMNLGLDDGLFDAHPTPLGKQENSSYYQLKQQASHQEPLQFLSMKKTDSEFSRQLNLAPALQEQPTQELMQGRFKENDASLAPPFR